MRRVNEVVKASRAFQAGLKGGCGMWCEVVRAGSVETIIGCGDIFLSVPQTIVSIAAREELPDGCRR
jgi:Na+-translocating ferredoxin:NAD+ oxidoreductase RnfE subunit